MRVKASMLAKDYKPSFLSFEKDQELIWRRLFIDNRQYGDMVTMPFFLSGEKIPFCAPRFSRTLSLRGKGALRVGSRAGLMGKRRRQSGMGRSAGAGKGAGLLARWRSGETGRSAGPCPRRQGSAGGMGRVADERPPEGGGRHRSPY